MEEGEARRHSAGKEVATKLCRFEIVVRFPTSPIRRGAPAESPSLGLTKRMISSAHCAGLTLAPLVRVPLLLPASWAARRFFASGLGALDNPLLRPRCLYIAVHARENHSNKEIEDRFFASSFLPK